MKTLNPLVRIAAVALLASGCEFHVGHYDGDASIFDDDDDAGSRPTATARPTATPPRATSAAPAADAGETPDGGAPDTGTDPTQAASSAAPPATTAIATATATPSASMTPNPSYLCVAPSSGDMCDQCVKAHCNPERTACCGASCEDIWPEVQQCMAMIQDAGDPVQAQEDLDTCIGSLDPNGNSMAFDMEMEFQLLLSCVNSTYPTPEDDSGHYPGDGTCTFECYGVTTLME